jgi:hypothetical protein
MSTHAAVLLTSGPLADGGQFPGHHGLAPRVVDARDLFLFSVVVAAKKQEQIVCRTFS